MKALAFTVAALALSPATAYSAPNVSGTTISWPDDGWYQVQVVNDEGIVEVCQGGRSCEVAPGDYIVINHTTGERFEGISVTGTTLPDAISVTGNVLSWPDDGWYQVQDETNYAEICGGTRSCTVSPGSYVVINHTSGQRFDGIEVTDSGTPASPIVVAGNVISWPDDGWYQVQDETDYSEICNGGRSCTAQPGSYVVINHTAQIRYPGIVIPTLPDEPGDGLIPETFTNRDATLGDSARVQLTHIDVPAIWDEPVRYDFYTVGLANRAGENKLAISYRPQVGPGESEFNRYAFIDVATQSFNVFWESSPFDSPVVSRDLSTVAWDSECQGYVQSTEPGSVAFHVNPMTREFTCVRQPTLSALGDVALFGSVRGEYDDDGNLEAAGSDNRNFGSILTHPASSTVTSLAMQDLNLDGIDPATMIPLKLRRSFADDGSLLALRIAFVPDNYFNQGVIDYVDGILLVTPDTGEYKLVGQQSTRREFCRHCYIYPAVDTVLSGNGRYVYYLQPTEDQSLNLGATSSLYRYDVENDEIEILPVDDVIENRSLITNHSGSTVGYLVDGTPVVLNVETGERINLDSAIRNCQSIESGENCEFEGYRTVRNNPFKTSGDGAALLIQLIPERPDIDEPQNTEEVFMFDTQTYELLRLAPDIDVSGIAVGESSHSFVIDTASPGLLADDNDLFLINVD